MAEKYDESFYQQRDETFDKVIALIEGHIKAVTPSLLPHFNDMSPEKLRAGTEREVWSLFQSGIQHLKNGAPGGQPGSMTESLSRTSLRSSSFAAALGVKPPQFEQMYFSVHYTTGSEAALFFCQRLIEAAKGDLLKSTHIIQQKILTEKPAGVFGTETPKDDIDTLKKQMALSFNILTEAYMQVCQELRAALSGMAPPCAPTSNVKTCPAPTNV